MNEFEVWLRDWKFSRLETSHLLGKELAKATMGHNKRRQKVNKGLLRKKLFVAATMFYPSFFESTENNKVKVVFQSRYIRAMTQI